MADRLNLQTKFEAILGNRNVYYQPPESMKLNYDAIVYSLNPYENKNADDKKYIVNKSYTVTYIHRDPDSSITDQIFALPMCSFDRRFIIDNLYHDVYKLYY